ncbi:3-oxoacyl-[acyl-carrier protein] reductase [Granulicella rosea]|uniref:3-oxoacyl-[acyl-carrier protein] reductase n=1 Tax=Granulicella rosea TaxID=474952 RepID=A0A239EP48_9BACT|nr:SDR family NAD(P)-dependent oxidoreductase [Granulicella rosea]SNS46446.1 3-oxoacyl-[acyl-carrier protein] reductase [Granulicella rosea]
MKLDFTGQTVAIGGAASAIGSAIASAFAEAGARVFCADRGALPTWPSLPDGIEKASVDLGEAGAVDAWIGDTEAATGGPVHILVNNAGGVAGRTSTSIESVSDEDWHSIIHANLTTCFHLSRAAVPGMKKAGRGVIVHIGSGASERASLTGVQAYCAAKHAVLGLTRQLAHELGPFGIRVNCIAPGFIPTNAATRQQWAELGDAGQQALIRSIALRRLGQPVDIANAVLLVASDYASFISGEIIGVNGGR